MPVAAAQRSGRASPRWSRSVTPVYSRRCSPRRWRIGTTSSTNSCSDHGRVAGCSVNPSQAPLRTQASIRSASCSDVPVNSRPPGRPVSVCASCPKRQLRLERLADDELRERRALGGRRHVGRERLRRVDAVGIETGVMGQVAPAELRVGGFLQPAAPLRGLLLGPAQLERQAGKDPDLVRPTAVLDGDGADPLPERERGLDALLRREDHVGDAPGEGDAGGRGPGLRQHRMALRRSRYRQRAGDVVVATVELGRVDPVEVGPDTAAAVGHDRVVVPAVPQAAGDIDELGCPRIAIVVLGMLVQPEVAGRVAVVRRDDVPADPPTGGVVGGREAPGEVERSVVRRRRGADQPDPATRHPERREDDDRVVPDLREERGPE